jgi:hypothetical protein
MKKIDQYHSVEFSVDNMSVPHQFKIWHVEENSMAILVREDSNILPHLRVGERLNMNYYSVNSVYPDMSIETAIKEINRDEQGRFKGHVLVGLELL